MTAAEIVEAVERMNDASRQARAWMAPGGACCAPPTRTPENFCANPRCQARGIRYATEFATEAAHYGLMLLALERRSSATIHWHDERAAQMQAEHDAARREVIG